jgi:hypothetical protein
MRKLLQIALGALVVTSISLAQNIDGGIVNNVPEIDGVTAASAVAMVAAGLMVLRSRRK